MHPPPLPLLNFAPLGSSSEQRRELLVQRFGPLLRERVKNLPRQLAQRLGDIMVTPSPSRVLNIGQHFRLFSLRGPAQQLMKLLVLKDRQFYSLSKMDKPMQHLHLLKVVAAPGMGKSTALGALWVEVYRLVSEHEDALRRQLQERGSNLVDRVLCSLKPDQPLVFIMDLSQTGSWATLLPHGVASQLQLAVNDAEIHCCNTAMLR